MTDLLIYDIGDGGDIMQVGNSLASVNGIENQPYLACFGGAADGSKWWADDLLFPGRPSVHYVSQTEKTLNSVAINSSGRIKIEEAVKYDLQYITGMVPGSVIDVNVVIVSDSRLDIKININGKQVVFYWYYNAQILAMPGIARMGVGRDIIESTLIVY